MTRNQSDAAPKRPGGKRPADSASDGERLSAAQVAGYLRRHRDFLIRHPDLIEVLETPRRDCGDGVADLQLFMVARLRKEISDVKSERDALVLIGRTNLAAQARVNRAVLALLAARSFEHLIEIATTDLAVMLDLDVVNLAVEQSSQQIPPVRLGGVIQLEQDTVDAVIGPGRQIVLCSDIKGDPAIFGAAAGLVRSAALIRLTISHKTPSAMLALASRQPEQFHPGQGTELMTFLARALEQCIRVWLNLSE